MELVVRDPSLPRPSISLSPTGVTTSGANATIRCQGQRRDVRFFLHKAGDLNQQRHTDPAGAGAEFRIPSVGRRHGGSYSCSYRPRSEPFVSSYVSSSVELVVAGGTDLIQPGAVLDPTRLGSKGPGCWLAGHSGVWGTGREYPKPTIWVSPSRVVALGGSVTIRCEGQYPGMEFVLHKPGHSNPQGWTVRDGTAAEFPIPSVGREDGGSYTCEYHSITDQNRWSYLSDPVEIIVAEPSYPKPSISLLSPSWGVSLGAAVTVQCCSQHQGLQFVLNKEGSQVQSVNSDDLALFHFNNVSREHGGNYTCSYRSQSEPSAVSYPSDPMELVVRDPSLPRPSISLNLTAPRADATIRCQGQRRDVRFFLYKAGDLNPQRRMDRAGDTAEFHIPTVGRQHGGNYSCSYRPWSEPFVSSELSDPVKIIATADFSNTNIARLGLGAGVLLVLGLILAEAYYSRPRGGTLGAWIRPYGEENLPGGKAASPRGTETTAQTPLPPNTPALENPPQTAPNLTAAPQDDLDMRIQLYKAGGGNYLTYTDPVGSGAEFPIISARQEHGGSYTCRYIYRSGETAYSEPSNPVQIIVADPSLPRPSISLSPTGVTAPGADVTIRCQGQRQDVRFFLHKAGDLNPQRHTDPAGAGAEFRIPTVGRQHGGSYSCSYRPRSEPFISSLPSDTVQLVVADERPSSMSPLPAPHPAGSSGGSAPMGFSEPGSALGPAAGMPGRGAGTESLGHSPAREEQQLLEICVLYLGLGGAEHWGVGGSAEGPLTALIMASALTILFLGCWLAGHSGVWGAGREYPKPTIWVSPSRVVALGGSVTIRCEGRNPGMEFVLRKAGHPNPQVWTVRDGTAAEFPIPSVSREDGGSYTCEYHSITEQSRWSYLSDPVEIIVAEPSYPKPSISLSPSGGVSLGRAVSVRCWGQHPGVRFVLNKEGRHFPPVDSDGSGAEFLISHMSREDGRSYSCSYHSRSEPFAVSDPSDPVELVVRGGTDATQPGAAPAPTHPGSVRPAAAPPGHPDFTHANIARLALGAAVLLVLGLILAEAYHSRPRGPP
ncbi:immunoglobulin superfamily member 1-like [Gopherus evgoodei]|uniref:immunoglobulin superfamily member 1-like n=1 Tax=Gopherus evgoodei TaxID=1825980 RepID=UPI0011CFFC39|nr:immunoglobulin superfamily member 1-like [Gopherus evgoodei]